MPSSVSFPKIFKAFNEARGGQQGVPRLCVLGAGPECERVVAHLTAGTETLAGGARLVDEVSPAAVEPTPRTFDPWDIIVVVAAGTGGREMAPFVRAARAGGRGVVAVVRGHEEDDWLRAADVATDEVARSYGPGAKPRPTLENRVVRAADHQGGALAAHLPAVRRAYCDHVILANAKQNGVIGVVVIIPGADMPAMTANQIRMVLQIAAAYGQEIGFDRAVEILSVVGSGFAFRALARQALTFVPGFGWVIKGAVGMSATLALGRAAVAYFEAGAPLQLSHMRRVEHQVDRVRAKLPDYVQRRLAGH